MPKAKNLKYLRTTAHLTQQALADELGVTLATVQSWEHHRTAIPTPATKRICARFDIPFDAFCDTDLSAGEHTALTGDEPDLITAYRGLAPKTQAAVRTILEGLTNG